MKRKRRLRPGHPGLLLGQWPPLTFVYRIQLAGTTAMGCFDYCPLARILLLMPWNRTGPLTLPLVRRTS